MKLLLIRHAIAEDREEFAQTGEPDTERPLTRRGQKRMRQAASGLQRLIQDYDIIVTSPLKRAMQTADIISEEYHGAPLLIVPALEPDGDFEAFLEWLKRLDDVQTVFAVGHESHISELAAWLLTGNRRPFFEMKKGGVALLEFGDDVRAGGAQLQWLLTAGHLRRAKR